MPKTSSPLLDLVKVSIAFDKRAILHEVSFSVHHGEIVTLIGPNGAGKSTVMKVALGLLEPDSGSVRRARDIAIGYMPQKILIEDFLPLSVRNFLKLRAGTTDEDVEQILKLVKVGHIEDSPVQSISGGEMQRVLMARALLGNPDLIVLDEPVQGVDIRGQQELYQLIERIREKRGCGVLMISHDLHMVMSGTDRVVCLNRHVCCSGTPDLVQKDPEYHALLGLPSEGLALYTHQHNHSHDSHGNVLADDTEVSGSHEESCDHDH